MTTAAERLSCISMTDTESTDWQDLRAAAEGDEEAFASIVERHQGRLLRLCERMLSDREEARDAVQEVFIKAYRKASLYRSRGQL